MTINALKSQALKYQNATIVVKYEQLHFHTQFHEHITLFLQRNST